MEDLKIAGYGKANGGNFNKIVINGYGEIFESAIVRIFMEQEQPKSTDNLLQVR